MNNKISRNSSFESETIMIGIMKSSNVNAQAVEYVSGNVLTGVLDTNTLNDLSYS